MKDYIDLIIAICSAISIIVPLIVKLVEYIKKAVNEKNWNSLATAAYDIICVAEESFNTGASKKSQAMNMLMALAKEMNYDVDESDVSELIDKLVDVTNKVNTKKAEE